MWINKFIGILIAINQKTPKDITEGILSLLNRKGGTGELIFPLLFLQADSNSFIIVCV